MREALAINRKTLTEPNATTLKYMTALAETLAGTSRLDEAEQLLREALALGENIGDPQELAFDLAGYRETLARLCRKTLLQDCR